MSKSALFLNHSNPLCYEATNQQFSLAGISKPSPIKEVNEDSYGIRIINDEELLITVADGVGGHPGGDIASAKAITRIHQALDQNPDKSPAEILLKSIEDTNQYLIKKHPGAATTLIVVHVFPKGLRSYAVGDSAVQVVGAKGLDVFSSKGQSSYDLGVEAGIINEEAEETEDLKAELTNYMGYAQMHVEVGSFQGIKARDFIIVGSDGLFDNVLVPAAIEEFKGGSPLKTLQYLEEKAQHNMEHGSEALPGKPDDLSIVVVRRS